MKEDYELSMSLDSIEKCRQIHNEIVNYGVSEQEKMKLISLMSFELENINLMRKIQETIKNEKDNKGVEEIEESPKEKLCL